MTTSPTAAVRHLWLCADDYGIAPGVNKAIRELIGRGRLNATSVMASAPHFNQAEAAALKEAAAGHSGVAVGLHVTLTAPFRPLSQSFAPVRDNAFPPLPDVFRGALLRRFRHDKLVAEIALQMRAFVSAFGRPPDFVDGHQHVQLFPQIRDAVLKAMTEAAPNAWVRQCGRPGLLAGRIRSRKALFLDYWSRGLRRRARRLGIASNPAFSGSYNFVPDADFAKLFPGFLDRMPENGVVMCHPGFVDAELQRLDSLTALREREFAYLNGDEFPAVLAANGVTLG